ncbi:MAG: 2-oxoacid:acceptor oxidoreductase subunit alpha [Nitrososphaeria archaeon]|nr:2-oxoglutarate oxidoreductase alpha subunit [uncultured archaeon]
MGRVLFTHGNDAIVEGAIAAGCRFYAGYPITPSSEIAEEMSKRLPALGGVYVQGEDELASINMIIGASMAGAKAMTATSGPGFSLMQEGIGLAVATETPIVVVDVMRAGPSTGIASKAWQGDLMQVRFGSHSDYEIISLYPSSVQEAFDLTVEAFNLAETYMAPVVLLSDGVLARMRERLYVKDQSELVIVNRRKPAESPETYMPYKRGEDYIPVIANFGEGYYVLKDSLTHDERGYYYERPDVQAKFVQGVTEKIRRNASRIYRWEERYTEDAEVLFVASGVMGRIASVMVREAREEGKKWGIFRPITIWPFPEDPLRKAARSASKVVTIEMSVGKLIYPVKWTIRDGQEVKVLPWLSYEAPSPDDLLNLVEVNL